MINPTRHDLLAIALGVSITTTINHQWKNGSNNTLHVPLEKIKTAIQSSLKKKKKVQFLTIQITISITPFPIQSRNQKPQY